MRKALLAVGLLLAALPSFAQQRPFRLSVFASDPGFTHSESSGTDVSGGIGAALEYRWNEQWALELSVVREEHTVGIARIGDGGVVHFDRREVRAYPVDLIAQYQFLTMSRWKPYLGAGLRYVSGQTTPFDKGHYLSPEISGGVHFMITPALSLRFDAKQRIGDDDTAFDSAFKPSVGFGWKF